MERHVPFGMKSLRPADSSWPGEAAGSQPMTAQESTDVGIAGRNESANTGRLFERGVGGSKRW